MRVEDTRAKAERVKVRVEGDQKKWREHPRLAPGAVESSASGTDFFHRRWIA
jgi:hypothetical protein